MNTVNNVVLSAYAGADIAASATGTIGTFDSGSGTMPKEGLISNLILQDGLTYNIQESSDNSTWTTRGTFTKGTETSGMVYINKPRRYVRVTATNTTGSTIAGSAMANLVCVFGDDRLTPNPAVKTVGF